jgi:hypothetical protein
MSLVLAERPNETVEKVGGAVERVLSCVILIRPCG